MVVTNTEAPASAGAASATNDKYNLLELDADDITQTLGGVDFVVDGPNHFSDPTEAARVFGATALAQHRAIALLHFAATTGSQLTTDMRGPDRILRHLLTSSNHARESAAMNEWIGLRLPMPTAALELDGGPPSAMHLQAVAELIADVAALREHGDEFAEWRSGLASALTDVSRETSEENWERLALTRLKERLGPEVEALRREVQRARSLRDVFGGTLGGFVLGETGALTGLALGSPAQTLISAGAPTLVGAIADYIRYRKRRRGAAPASRKLDLYIGLGLTDRS